MKIKELVQNLTGFAAYATIGIAIYGLAWGVYIVTKGRKK